jgi:hypothetical protein
MKKFYLLMIITFLCTGLYAQANYDDFIGTWVYQKNDTVFKIKLQKGRSLSRYGNYDKLFGGYYLSVKGEVREDFIKPMPSEWEIGSSSAPSNNIYIEALGTIPDLVGFKFYDQSKKHLDGSGITGGEMKLIFPTRLHWTLDELSGLQAILGHGLWIRDDDMRPIRKETLRGFSVPTDVIMVKTQEE